jgi:hypothetical protein
MRLDDNFALNVDDQIMYRLIVEFVWAVDIVLVDREVVSYQYS